MDLMLDQSRTSVPLEFMPHGDLWGFMMSCARAKRDIPDDMLWMIFACRKWIIFPADHLSSYR